MNALRRGRQSLLAASFLVGLLVAAGLIGFRASGSLEGLELFAYDWYLRLIPKKADSAGSRIVLIGVNEDDIHRQGRWPLSDATLADALSLILKARPRAIGLDIFRDVDVPPGSEALRAVLRENSQIVAAIKIPGSDTRGVPPPPELAETDQVGFNDILVDPGGIVRRGLLFLDHGGEVAYSLALRLALRYLEQDGIMPVPDPNHPGHIRLGHTTLPRFRANDGGYVDADDRGYQLLMDFKDARTAFKSYSLTELLEGNVPDEALEDKIVLIGVTAESVKDLFYTPDSVGFRDRQQTSGIGLHARLASQFLRAALENDLPIRFWPERWEWLWILAWSLGGAICGLWGNTAWRFSLIAAGGLLLLFVATYFPFRDGWWIPVVPPALAWVISASLVTAYVSSREEKERAQVMQLFSRYVAPEVARDIWEQRDTFWHGGRPRSQKLMATVLISDLKGFTAVAETLEPEVLMDWLNSYMDAMTRIVMQHGGVIDDYAGDGLKADFGVPLARTTEAEMRQDARNAVACSVAMEKELGKINAIHRANGLPETGMRIGIFTGPVIVGSLGSADRLKYTTLGDTVNVAARLENLDDALISGDIADGNCRILIGQSTLDRLGGGFQLVYVGEALLRGKSDQIRVYQVIEPPS